MQQILGLFILTSMIVGAILMGQDAKQQYGETSFVSYLVGAFMAFALSIGFALIFSLIIALLMGVL